MQTHAKHCKTHRGTLTMALVALSSLLFLSGCQEGHTQQTPLAPVPEVATVELASQLVELTTELSGRTSPYLVSEIRPQVKGIIQKRMFQEGSDVKAGDLVCQIDPAPSQAAYAAARASLAKAQANLPSIRSRTERYRNLLQDKAVSRQGYDDATPAVQLASPSSPTR